MPQPKPNSREVFRWLAVGEDPPDSVARKRRPLPPEPVLETVPKRFDWTKEELNEAVQLGLDRLYLGDTTLDAYLPRALRLDRVAVSVQRAKKRLGEEAYQALARRYL